MSHSRRKFTDLFIERPVLATVVSLLILLLGLRAMESLQLREYPKMENTVITVTTAYPGAPAELIQGFITQLISKSISGAEGVEYISSSSTDSTSTVTAQIRLNYDPEKAFTNVMSKVSEVEGQLPQASQRPVITKTTGSRTAILYLAYQSDDMTPQQVTNYISSVIQPVFATVPGVAQVQLMGGGYTYAMRIWLNPERMAALGVSPSDVSTALARNNFQSASGATKGKYLTVSIRAMTDLQTAAGFRQIVVKHNKGTLVHLGDIAKVELGQEDYNGFATYNGKMATYVAINPTPTANPLSVVKSARKVLKQLETNFPPGLNQTIVYDATAYINDSLNEVERTIGEATLIVIIVIFLFLGSLRTVIIPVVTIPLSLIGAMSIMLMLGYSLNLLTLLAMVLAIGLVVDDAIVVVENVHRHIELGASRFQAAIAGAREIATPVIAMTITLAAVYAPIGFMSGLTGALFTEFAFTLAATVVVSGVIALTLSPMMCSKLFKEEAGAGRYTVWLDAKMDALKELYARILASVLNYRPIVLVCGVILLACCGVFFMMTQSELAPQEDQSMLWMQGTGPDATNIDYTTKFSSQFVPMLEKEKAVLMSFIINGAEGQNSVIGGIRLKPWSQRSQSAGEIGAHLQKVIGNNPGLRVNVVQPSSLPTGSSSFFPISFVIKSTGDFAQLYEVAERMVAKANASGHFLFLINSLRFNKPQVVFNIDRDKAAQMGIDMQTIGDSLGAALSGNYVNRFSMMNQSFEVIPQLERRFRANYEQLENIYIKNMNNEMIPLSNLVRIEQQVEPSSLSQFQQLNSATLEGLAMPGQTNLDGLHYLMGLAKKYFAPGMSFDFSGESRTAIEESNALTVTFFFSLIVIYLVLAAQYESFTDPIIILVSVPMSIFGALLPLFLGAATINIYTQIGLLTLIGLISKHGILMVDFANHLQQVEKLNRREAIIKAASIRLRPILMTTAAMILGVLPLALATGAGAVSRRNIGDVIMAGMSIGTLFTLIVVPTVYSYLAKNHQKELEQAHAG